MHRPISSFVFAGKGSDARIVMVNGDIVYRDGLFSRFSDGARMIAEAERIAKAVLEQAGLGHRLEPAWRQ